MLTMRVCEHMHRLKAVSTEMDGTESICVPLWGVNAMVCQDLTAMFTSFKAYGDNFKALAALALPRENSQTSLEMIHNLVHVKRTVLATWLLNLQKEDVKHKGLGRELAFDCPAL